MNEGSGGGGKVWEGVDFFFFGPIVAFANAAIGLIIYYKNFFSSKIF